VNGALIFYAPVLHQGYLEFLRRKSESVERCYILSDEIIEQCSWGRRREIREVPPHIMAAALNASGASTQRVEQLKPSRARVHGANSDFYAVMPKLEICQRFAEYYLPKTPIEWDSVFLQWDEANVISQSVVTDDYRLSGDEFDRRMIALGREAAANSSDWWRHVGAVAVHDGEVILTAYNHHVPGDQTQYVNGDPRDFVLAGTDSQIATALHAEQAIIVDAARKGISLEAFDLYVPVFPCPMCAKMIAYAGFRRVFFTEGHASLDGEAILRDQGIDIVLVQRN
jgi:dCMP deaminase